MRIFDHHAMHPADMKGLSNQDLADRFLAAPLFVDGELLLRSSAGERLVIGGAVPAEKTLDLVDPFGGKGAFLDRRELGVFNIGDAGTVTVDGAAYAVGRHECLYVGKGAGKVQFSGHGARFYLVSAPAHQQYPTRLLTLGDANVLERGELATANRRTIRQLIVPGVCDSAQLALGVTFLDTGSVWNTMPPHRHGRRSEIYMYFDMAAEDRVFHFMGEPDALRHIVVANEQAVVSPPWSVHFGVGTRAYGFVWAMGGDNIDYDDMDVIGMEGLK